MSYPRAAIDRTGGTQTRGATARLMGWRSWVIAGLLGAGAGCGAGGEEGAPGAAGLNARREVAAVTALGEARGEVAAVSALGEARGGVATDVEDRYRAFADRIAGQLERTGTPGGALAIVEDGRLAFVTGMGVKRAGGADAVGADTVFRVASTSKTLVAAMVMALTEEGRVSLDAPVTRYLPELRLLPPFDPAQLTLRRLLSHTAGVPDHIEPECAEGPGALGAWFDAHPDLVLWSPPGRLWSYSNLGFSLAGLAAERAAGAPFRELIEGRVLEPLGMATATFDVDEVLAGGDYAVAHAADGRDPTFTRCALTEPPGYLYASVTDLGKLVTALLAGGGDALSPWSVVQMALPTISTQAPPEQVYGLGLFALPDRGRLIVGHPGDLPGLHAALWMVPQARFGVVMLVNGDAYPPIAAAIQAIDTFVGAKDIPPPDWMTPPSDWGRYVGHYDGRIPAGGFPALGLGLMEVTLEGEQLVLTTFDDGARYPLTQLARDTFSLTVEGIELPLTFWRDRSGQAEYLATRAGHAARMAASTGPPAAGKAPFRAAGESALLRLARQPSAPPRLPVQLR